VGSVPKNTYQTVGKDDDEDDEDEFDEGGYDDEYDEEDEEEDGYSGGGPARLPTGSAGASSGPVNQQAICERFAISLLREERLGHWSPEETGKLVALLVDALGFEERPNKTLNLLQDAAMPVTTPFFSTLNQYKQLLPGSHMLELLALTSDSGPEYAETVTEMVQQHVINLSEPGIADQVRVVEESNGSGGKKVRVVVILIHSLSLRILLTP